MTIELRNGNVPGRPHRAVGPDRLQALQASLLYRGVDIRIAVQRTPGYVFGQADLLDGEQYIGRLSIGNPQAAPEQVHQRICALAQARVDILKAARSRENGGCS